MRDVMRPIPETPIRVPKDECGFCVDEARQVQCGKPSLYRFRMANWPSHRFGNSCAEHAQIVRYWEGLEFMRTRRRAVAE